MWNAVIMITVLLLKINRPSAVSKTVLVFFLTNRWIWYLSAAFHKHFKVKAHSLKLSDFKEQFRHQWEMSVLVSYEIAA